MSASFFGVVYGRENSRDDDDDDEKQAKRAENYHDDEPTRGTQAAADKNMKEIFSCLQKLSAKNDLKSSKHHLLSPNSFLRRPPSI